LADQDFVKETVAKNAVERKRWQTYFEANGYQFDESAANFIFFADPQAEALAEYLRQNGYLLRTGLRPGWLRLTIGTAEDNAELRRLMTEFKR